MAGKNDIQELANKVIGLEKDVAEARRRADAALNKTDDLEDEDEKLKLADASILTAIEKNQSFLKDEIRREAEHLRDSFTGKVDDLKEKFGSSVAVQSEERGGGKVRDQIIGFVSGTLVAALIGYVFSKLP